MATLSVIIVSWNTCKLLEDCLHSVEAEIERIKGVNAEVLVVDNASVDGSPAMVRERFPHVRLLVNAENVGFARANNQAIQQAQGRYLCLLNPDTEVKSGAFERLVDFLERHPDVGAVGPLLLNPDGTLQESCYPAPTLLREFWRMFHLDVVHQYSSYPMAQWSRHDSKDVDILKGACILLRSEVVGQVGLLDDSYFMYSEEVDLCHRIRRAGWRICWEPQAEVVHYGGQSTQQVAEEMFLRLYESKILYFRKHYGWGGVWLYKCILLMATIVRLVLSPLAWLQKTPKGNQNTILAKYYRHLLFELPGM